MQFAGRIGIARCFEGFLIPHMKFRSFLTVLGLVLSFAVAQAQVVFTATGTANAAGFGYTQGQAVTFVFTTAAGLNIGGQFDGGIEGTYNEWTENSSAGSPVWSAVTGTSLSGSYERPAIFPDSYIHATSLGDLRVLVSTLDGAEGLGLFAGGVEVKQVEVRLTLPTPFSSTPVYTSAEAFFSNYAGTYTSFTSPSFYLIQNGGNVVGFNLTQLSISVVPEPSTYVALAGLGMLGFVLVQRLRRSRQGGFLAK